jgi:hypothetical protein
MIELNAFNKAAIYRGIFAVILGKKIVRQILKCNYGSLEVLDLLA